MQRSTQTYDVREVTAHFNDCLVDCSQQLLCDDLNMPLCGTLQDQKSEALITLVLQCFISPPPPHLQIDLV